jgi:ATP adenylyltransferase
MEYISGAKSDDCVFCIGDDPEQDRQRLVLFRSQAAFVILNIYPYTSGHLMAIPYRHTATMSELDDLELLDLVRMVRLSCNILETEYAPHGFNIGMNLGLAAGAGVKEHLHYHIVPRWNGDSNYMAVTAETRVIPEDLTTTYNRLRPHFAALAGGGG